MTQRCGEFLTDRLEYMENCSLIGPDMWRVSATQDVAKWRVTPLVEPGSVIRYYPLRPGNFMRCYPLKMAMR